MMMKEMTRKDLQILILIQVLVQLLPGGDIFEIFGETFCEHEHGSIINQKLGTLNRTIFPNLEFTFVNQDETKKIKVVIGNISFSLGFNP